ncbi:autotransporter-associated beta strand repeat-containing protein [Luteolibacter sp. Populi]|uniref:autotransporter-associated beta strand repeat-containing protein n=1 Tax=Luteolibacter sp. Populi TaxID=3230487 RepID=UPI0034658368
MALALLVLAFPVVSSAGTYTVSNHGDTVETGTLRWAITQANSNPGSTITFIAGLSPVVLSSALPMITTAVTINGGAGTTISGNYQHRVFFVATASATDAVKFQNLTIANGYAKGGDGGISGGGGLGAGGAIFVNKGAVSIAGVTLSGNAARGGNGGNRSTRDGVRETAGGGGGGGLGGNGGRGSYDGGGGGGGYQGNGGNSISSGPYRPGGGGGGGISGNGGDSTGENGGGGGGTTDGGSPMAGTGGGAGAERHGNNFGTAGADGGGGGGAAGDWPDGPLANGGAGGTYGGGGGAALCGGYSHFDSPPNGAGGAGGDFGGGGGVGSQGSQFSGQFSTRAGPGGFGGGGGSGSAYMSDQRTGSLGGFGGFGGGGGGTANQAVGPGGAYGGSGGYVSYITDGSGLDGSAGGGGGAALGGAIFVRSENGASLEIQTLTESGSTATAGLAGLSPVGGPKALVTKATAGQGLGSGIFLPTGNSTFYGGTIGGEIAGVSGSVLRKVGGGTLMILGTSKSDTHIMSGTVSIGNGGTTGAFTGNVTNDTALIFNRFDALSYDGSVSGIGSLIKLGDGTLTLTGNNSSTGGTSVDAGVLALSGAGDSSRILDTTINAGGTLRLLQSHQIGTSRVAVDGGTFDFNGQTDGFAWLIMKNGGTVSGGGMFTLESIGSPLLTATGGGNAGTIATPFGITSQNGLGGNADRTVQIDVAAATRLTISGTIRDTLEDGAHVGSVNKTSPGTLLLTGDNTYTGGTTISAGTLQIGNGENTGSITGNIINNGALIFNRSGALSYDGSLSGTGSLTKLGDDTLTLTGANPYTGTTTISGGTVVVGGTNASSSHAIAAGAVLEFNLGSGSRDQGAGTVVSGGGTLVKSGAGTVSWGEGATTFQMASGSLIDVQGGTLIGGSNGNEVWSANLSDLNVAADARFWGAEANVRVNALTGSGAIHSGLSGAGYTTFSFGVGNGSGIFAGVLADTDTVAGQVGHFTKTGNGWQTLTGTNTYTGGTTIAAGTLQLGNNGTTGSIIGNVINNSTLAFNRSDSFAYAGLVSGSGSVTKLGDGTLTFTTAQTYTGGTTISAGTLQLGNGGVTGLLEGSVINNGNLTFNGSDSVTVANLISGTGAITKHGTGTLTLANNNTYSGATTISGGTVAVGGTSRSSAFAIASGALLELNSTSVDRDMLGSSTFSGTGTLRKTGAGGVYWGASAATFAMGSGGLIDVQGGAIYGGSNANDVWTGNLADLNVAPGARFQGGEANVRVDALSGPGRIGTGSSHPGYQSFTFGVDNGSGSFSGVLADDASHAGNFTKAGTGTQILSGANTYTGTTMISKGTLAFTGSMTGTGALTVGSGGTLAGTSTLSMPVTVQSDGTIAPGNNGAGTLALSGAVSLSSGCKLNFELGTLSDKLALNGSYTPPAGGAVIVNAAALAGFGDGTYPLITGAAGISAGSFSLGAMPPGHSYSLNAAAGTLSLNVSPLSSPSGLAAVAGAGQVSLTWSPTGNATGYNLKRSTQAGGPYTVIAANVPGPGHADTGLMNGTRYYYVVSALYSGAESPDSGEVSALPLAPLGPAELLAPTLVRDGDLMHLSIASSSLGRSYQLQRSLTLAGNSWENIGEAIPGTGAGLTFDDSPPAEAEHCFFRIVILP